MQWRAIEPAHDEAAPAIRHSSRDALGLLGRLEDGEHAAAGAAHARLRRTPERARLTREPVERLAARRVAPAHDRLTHVTDPLRRKVAYCDDGRIACQFRGLEDLCGAHRD